MLGMGLLGMWDNGGRNINMHLAEFIDMGPRSRDSAFGKGVRKVSNSLLDWLVETWIKR